MDTLAKLNPKAYEAAYRRGGCCLVPADIAEYRVEADDIPYHGRRYSINVALPPLSASLFKPELPHTTAT